MDLDQEIEINRMGRFGEIVWRFLRHVACSVDESNIQRWILRGERGTWVSSERREITPKEQDFFSR